MRVLVIGGTIFLGRWVVTEALLRGHEVTVLHRGRHGRGMFPQAQELLGDRRDGLSALDGRSFDAVVDTCAYSAADAEATAGIDTGHYTLVSTIGVYRDWPEHPVADESAPVHEIEGDAYELGKAAAERVLEAAMPGRVLHLRPGVVVGPHEYVGRLPWWLARMAEGGPTVAPGPPDAPLQLVDARDLAELTLDCAERGDAGPLNAVGEPGHLRWGDVLEACRDVTGGAAELVWLDPERVARAVQDPWRRLPLWPSPAPEVAGIYAAGGARARELGLRPRPFEETAADTWTHLQAEPLATGWREAVRAIGLTPREETILLAALGAPG